MEGDGAVADTIDSTTGGARKTRVTIGILTCNGAQTLPAVLDALLRFDYDKKRIRLVFVDNESTDGTTEITSDFDIRHKEEYESLQIVELKSTIPEARNVCLRHAAGTEYLFFLDSDVIAGPRAIGCLLNHFERDDTVGVAALPYDSENSKGKLGFLARAFNTPAGVAAANKVATGCTLFSMKVMQEVGSFNERLKVLEDGEYCYRVRAAGYRIVCDFGYHAEHLKRIHMDATSYLAFARDSAAFYLELATLRSKIYILRYALSVILIATFLAVLVRPDIIEVFVLALVGLLSIVANSSNKLWGDGSTIKLRYRPLVGVVFTAATLVITVSSLWPVVRRSFVRS